MGKNSKIIFLLTMFVLCTIVLGNFVQADEGVPENVMVSVNGEYIYQEVFDRQLDRQLFSYMNSYGSDLSSPEFAEQLLNLKKQLLESLIGNEVLRQTALELGIEVTDAEIQAELNNIKANYPNEETFMQTLEKVKYSLEDLCTDIKLQKSFDKISEHLGKDEMITEEEIKNYYETNLNRFSQPEQVKASHILVNTEEEIKAIAEQLKNGADFAQLAKEKSTCPSSERGGDLGYFGRGQMVPEFEYVSFNTEVGKISEPVKTEFGWHIIMVVDKKEAVVQDFEEVKEQIKETLLLKKKSTKAIDYLKSRWEKAEVEYYVDFELENQDQESDN